MELISLELELATSESNGVRAIGSTSLTHRWWSAVASESPSIGTSTVFTIMPTVRRSDAGRTSYATPRAHVSTSP